MEDDRPKTLKFFACLDAFIVLNCALESLVNSGQRERAVGKTSQQVCFKKQIQLTWVDSSYLRFDGNQTLSRLNL
jgi:hypothetical protein